MLHAHTLAHLAAGSGACSVADAAGVHGLLLIPVVAAALDGVGVEAGVPLVAHAGADGSRLVAVSEKAVDAALVAGSPSAVAAAALLGAALL